MSTVDETHCTVEETDWHWRSPWRGGKRLVGVLLGAGLLLAACSSGGAASGSDSGDKVLAVKEHPDIGSILVDSSGRTLYFADQESGGKIQCVDQCLSFWFPVTVKDGKAPPGVKDVTVVHRQDNNQDQLAYQGKPLYTFKQDGSAGDVSGNNFSDAFGDKQFNWHVATVGSAGDSPTPTPSSDGGGGYGGGGY